MAWVSNWWWFLDYKKSVSARPISRLDAPFRIYISDIKFLLAALFALVPALREKRPCLPQSFAPDFRMLVKLFSRNNVPSRCKLAI